jgi:hypothetical protein
MERIVIHQTTNTPEILFDGNSGILKISGRSIPEGPSKLYEEVLNGIDEYSKDPQDLLSITFDLEFFNTATAREIIKILRRVNQYSFESKVIWIYEEGDDDMEEAGLDFEEIMKDINFEFIEKPEES